MYRKFGVDFTVYDRDVQVKAQITLFSIIVISILAGLFLGKIPVMGEYGVYMPLTRFMGTILLVLIYTGVYIYAFFNKEATKLFLGATSIGVLLGAFVFMIIILYKDVELLKYYVARYGSSNSFGDKFTFFGDYFSTCYLQFIPPLLFLLIANIFRLCMRGKGLGKDEKNSGMYGSSSFANERFLKDSNIITTSNTLFGKDFKKDEFLSYPLGNRTVISKPGGGKTTGITIPALLTEDRPCFVHDPKGELWAVTAAYRIKKFDRKIITIDPFGVTNQEGFRYPNDDVYTNNLKRSFVNPLNHVPDDPRYRDRFITSLVRSIVKASSSKNPSEASEHFTDNTEILIGGMLELILDLRVNSKFENVIRKINRRIDKLKSDIDLNNAQKAMEEANGDSHISTAGMEIEINSLKKGLTSDLLSELIFHKSKEEPTLFEIYQLLNRDLVDVIKDMKFIMKHGSIRAQQAAATLLTTGENERGSILSSTRRQLMWLVDSNLRETFTLSTENLKEFIEGNTDIYIIMPEDQINQQSRCIRMLLSIVQSLLVQTEVSKLSKSKYLFLLDELGQLDYNPDVEQAISILRARKCVFWSIFQTYSQIEKYQKPDLFIDTDMLQFFSVGDPKVMTMIQKLGGKQTKLIERANHNSSKSRNFGSLMRGSSSESEGSSTYETQADLIHFNEIRELPKDEQFVFIDGMKPIHCKKIQYFTDPHFKDYALNPIEDFEAVMKIINSLEKKQKCKSDEGNSVVKENILNQINNVSEVKKTKPRRSVAKI
jgi:type IV secretory pathway TraG/TraD family ATPase VirD4